MKYSKREYLWLIASFICTFGDVFTTTAIPILTYKITNSARFAILVFALDVLPEVVLSPFIGDFIDKHSKKMVLMVSCIFSSIILMILPIFNDAWVYLFGNSILSISNIFYSLTVRTALPSIAEENTEFSKLNSVITFALKLARVAGASIATLGVLYIGTSKLLWIDASTFIFSALIIIFIRFKHETIDYMDVSDNNSIGFGTVFEFFKEDKYFGECTCMYATMFAVEIALNSLAVVYITGELNLGDAHYGLYQNIQLVGICAAQLLLAHIVIARKEKKLIYWGMFLINVGVISIVLLKAPFLVIVIGIMHPFVEMSWYSLFYNNVRNEIMGKTLSVCTVVFDIIELITIGVLYIFSDIFLPSKILIMYAVFTLIMLFLIKIVFDKFSNTKEQKWVR